MRTVGEADGRRFFYVQLCLAMSSKVLSKKWEKAPPANRKGSSTICQALLIFVQRKYPLFGSQELYSYMANLLGK